MVNNFYKFIIKITSTIFYLGYLPFIPGTFGSLAGVILFYLFKENPFIYLVISLFITILGFLVAGRAEKIFNKKDARYIVIDETSGMLLSFMFVPFDIKIVIIGFVLFRIIDALKPFPAASLQDLKGSMGVMSDDLVAGLYTNIILQIVLSFTSLRIS
jgi:phosphatidylglycerophosphatase A